ncbi:MAG: acylphosphatase [Kofleriaceae bacterium]
MRRVRAIVNGRVQGVSFRATTVEQATQLGVVGWVKNRSDGCIELEAEGTPEQVAALLAWCEQGPPHARVARFGVEELAPVAPHLRERAFTITG